MGRVEEAEPFQRFVGPCSPRSALCFMISATPLSIIVTVSEIRAMGGGTHPILGFLGVMSAKIARGHPDPHTFMASSSTAGPEDIDRPLGEDGPGGQLHLRGRRSSSSSSASWILRRGERQDRPLGAAGQLGPVRHRVDHHDLDVFLYRKPRQTGEVRWGRMPAISQDVLIFIAVTFTWLMGHGLCAVGAPPALACLPRDS